MKKLLFLSILLTSFICSNAQHFEWAKHIGSGGGVQTQAVAITTDDGGNVYTTGFSGDTLFFDLPDTANFMTAPSGGQYSYITKTDSSGNYIWTRQLGGISNNFPLSIAVDSNGNVYSCGFFTDTTDFDPGAGVYKLGSTNSFTPNSYISKLDASGNFIWAKKIGGGENYPFSLSLDPSGNVFITGKFMTTCDMDPGAAIVNLVSAGSEDVFILKLNAAGDYVWAKGFGAAGLDRGVAIKFDPSGYLYLGGFFHGTVDFDPGAGTVPYTANASDDAFTAKFDTAGTFIWAKHISGSGEEYVNGITSDDSGNCYVTGLHNGITNFDPGASGFTISSNGSNDVYVVKYDANGNFIWMKNFGGNSSDYANSIVAKGSHLYVAGYFSDWVDFDPSPGVNALSSAGMGDSFVLKLNMSGNYIWAVGFGGMYDNYGTVAAVDANRNVYSTGYFEFTTDADPSPGSTLAFTARGYQDAFLNRMSQDTCSDMSTEVISFSPINCAGPGTVAVNGLGGLEPYTYVWNTVPVDNDSAATFMTSGIYDVTITASNACVKTLSFLVEAPDSLIGFDLTSNLINESFRPGYESNLWINVYNDHCTPGSGILTLDFDSSLVYFNFSLPAPDYVTDTAVGWNLPTLTFDSVHFAPQVNLLVKTTATTSDTLLLTTFITPFTGDIDTTNNVKDYILPIVNSFDPNDKSVSPKGNCNAGYIPNGQKLTYTVRFQNTGTASAINIFVLDTLDTDLDINSVHVVGNSDPIITEILPGNVLKFMFANILLPDSVSNEPESHGYVVFEVMPQPTLPNGTTITNDVGIYFDFNPPVYTNTVLNTISDGTFDNATMYNGTMITAHLSDAIYQWIDCTTGDSIAGATDQNYTPLTNGNYAVIISDGCTTDTSDCVPVIALVVNEPVQNIISIYPNPANNSISIGVKTPTQLRIVNMLGETVIVERIQSQTEIDISGLAKGLYFVQTDNGYSTKLIKQ